jgi:hypothetical protein
MSKACKGQGQKTYIGLKAPLDTVGALAHWKTMVSNVLQWRTSILLLAPERVIKM